VSRRGLLCWVSQSPLVLAAELPAAGPTDQPRAAPAVPADQPAGAPTEPDSAARQSQPAPRSFWAILSAGGPVGVLIILLSIAAVALVVEHLLTIREVILMPPGLADEVRELAAAGKLAAARQRCRMQPSFLAFVFEAGLSEVEGGWPAVEKAMEDAAADQSARLLRKVEYLSVIGNLAPMLGLLGTVIGMILAFRRVAETQGAARAADLAQGIYLALVTTVEGLIVAIPSLGAFAVFRNRVDQLVAEVAYVAQHALTPLKRALSARSPSGTGAVAGAAAPGRPSPPPPPVAGGA